MNLHSHSLNSKIHFSKNGHFWYSTDPDSDRRFTVSNIDDNKIKQDSHWTGPMKFCYKFRLNFCCKFHLFSLGIISPKIFSQLEPVCLHAIQVRNDFLFDYISSITFLYLYSFRNLANIIQSLKIFDGLME